MSIATIVARAMERVAPLRLAEKWDNVGLIVEAPFARKNSKRILLTIDLTPAVLEEALSTPTSVIVSYHPPIFRPLVSLTLSNSLQSTLLKCVAAGISIYSPHTALDCVKGGINDWLAQGLTGLGQSHLQVIEPKEDDKHTGSGRILTYEDAVPLGRIVASIKAYLGLNYSITGVESSPTIKSVAICAGSGGSLLKDVPADMYFTGEMSHHEVLAAIARGTHVVLCGHDNTERGYLSILQKKLMTNLSSEEAGPFEVVVSTQDRHPLETV
ncbi:NGG1p interacting factor 3 [Ramaria rubella]|nr:NGG1p interacting factor 3 [Ramaria rubella]